LVISVPVENETTQVMKPNYFTYLGIALSYTTISGVNWLFKTYNSGYLNNTQVILKESIILGLVGILCWVIIPKEKQNLESIGLHTRHWGKSLVLALGILVASLAAIAAAVLLSQQLGWSFGESKAFDKLSLWTVTLVVIRAGVAEEVFMRGFLLERLKSISGSTTVAVVLSLIPFALLHYAGQGWAGVLVSFAAGAVLTVFYLWKRDLKANIIAHFTIDFVPNVLLQMFA
jgi:membrane protease YdiL (CAAX protease family)